MPDLANLSMSTATVTDCPTLKLLTEPEHFSDLTHSSTSPVKTLPNCYISNHSQEFPAQCLPNRSGFKVFRRSRNSLDAAKKAESCKSLEDNVRAWYEKKINSGLPASRCSLPFLFGSPRMDECLVCRCLVYHGDKTKCSVLGCQGVFHMDCAKATLGISNLEKFKCSQHACFVCKKKSYWRCTRCTVASHDKCAPWPELVTHLEGQPGRAICWRHPEDWRLDGKVNFFFPPEPGISEYTNIVAVCWLTGLLYLLVEQNQGSTNSLEEVFCRLPIPYTDEEFKIDPAWKDAENKLEPPSYTHIRRNIYLIKKKRSDVDMGCTSCKCTCSDNCVCRVQCISCSKACRCSDNCTNRPFRKEKKIKVVKTELCGWGVEAVESINKGEFVIEYIGEVIDDALCEKRLWEMKYKGVQNFYMCEIRKDFTIDATFKGNYSRFLNHSCDPNCFLEKWQVEGETRVGVFAARQIEAGEPLTYDYRFVQFGPEVKCHCGTRNCQGFLGTKRKIGKIDLCWGSKRKRTSTACISILKCI